MSGKHDDGGCKSCIVPFLQQRDSIITGHPDIKQYGIKILQPNRGTGGCGVVNFSNGVIEITENFTDQLTDIRFIIDDQYLW